MSETMSLVKASLALTAIAAVLVAAVEVAGVLSPAKVKNTSHINALHLSVKNTPAPQPQ
jgi:hypothetical protein